ncbi:hypothetical protein FJ422_30790 [Mesorhizobium sp. B2-6-3]|uniref:hypothetical protein n=1 Tax=Mesorhizobium sp. B2-6-3 TaxID=2589914 RepID=UPI00112C314B|nr:hypothetical protein [Mesorhizobium sp. B2-6-3]TPJ75808.1 hypothetical protein FJ422_30790 [Mesorhizobium sp. B2-6-3]
MAFVKATIEIRPASVGTGIKASLRKGKASAAKMMLSISLARAKSLNIGDGDALEVLIGDGEHHGLLRIRKNNSAGIAKAEKVNTAKGEYFTLRLGHQETFVDRTESACWCQWEQVEDGWVEIVLPRWADETRPGRKEPALRAPAVAASRPKHNVTSGLMGDPPAGRREMLAKMGNIKP